MENPLEMELLMGKSSIKSINGPFSMAMLNNQRVTDQVSGPSGLPSFGARQPATRSSPVAHPNVGHPERFFFFFHGKIVVFHGTL